MPRRFFMRSRNDYRPLIFPLETYPVQAGVLAQRPSLVTLSDGQHT